MRMNAADTSASSAIALCTLLTVVSRSWTTALIDTFMIDVSTTRTNMAMQSRRARRGFASGEGFVSSIGLTCGGVGRTVRTVAPFRRREHRGEFDDSRGRGRSRRGREGGARHAGRGAVRDDPRLLGDER